MRVWSAVGCAGLGFAALGLQQAPTRPESFANIRVAPLGKYGGAFEPSVAVNKKNPKNIIAASMRTAIVSMDGGKTWAENALTSTLGEAGDPALITDVQGNVFFFHLSSGSQPDGWLDRMVCQKSTDGGNSWSDGASIGMNHPADQDKEWPAVHPSKPFMCLTWTQFDKYGSKSPSDKSNIMFSASSDAGDAWFRAVRINDVPGDCLDGDDTTEGAVPAIGKDGTVYVSWSHSGTIYFDRSADGGRTWLPADRKVAKQVGGWDMDIPGIGRANGMPVLMIDNSGGPHADTLYLCWADQREGVDDTDIFLARSTDKGETWTAPQRINQDAKGRHQFFPWIAVDWTTGYAYIVYYDRRAYADNRTDVYIAHSTNGGAKWTETVLSESPFLPRTGPFFGDYNNISAHGGVIAAIWTRMDDGKTSLWTSVIKQTDLIKER